jgi:hypothetical protein
LEDAMKTFSTLTPYLLLALLGVVGLVTAARGDTAALGGWIEYYDEEWNIVGEWYKPCSGQASHWGVVGVNTEILDWWDCEGQAPEGCIPTIVNCGRGCTTSSTSLVCY